MFKKKTQIFKIKVLCIHTVHIVGIMIQYLLHGVSVVE